MEPCVSCVYLTYCISGICENVPYESVYFKELHNDQKYYREEKSIRHFAMVAKFLDDDKPKIHSKSKFALFQTSSMLFSFIQFVKCWRNFFGLNPKGPYLSLEKEKEPFCTVFTYSVKRVSEIRKFHVAVVQRLLKNVQRKLKKRDVRAKLLFY